MSTNCLPFSDPGDRDRRRWRRNSIREDNGEGVGQGSLAALVSEKNERIPARRHQRLLALMAERAQIQRPDPPPSAGLHQLHPAEQGCPPWTTLGMPSMLLKNIWASRSCLIQRTLMCRTALRISFDDISLCNYRVIFKISLKYRYRIFFENITWY